MGVPQISMKGLQNWVQLGVPKLFNAFLLVVPCMQVIDVDNKLC